LTHTFAAKSCGGPSLARVFTVHSNSLSVVVVLGLLAIVVWSLIALLFLSTEDLEDQQIPGGIVWLTLGMIGFSAVLVLISAYI
jgi:hypothetical protein